MLFVFSHRERFTDFGITTMHELHARRTSLCALNIFQFESVTIARCYLVFCTLLRDAYPSTCTTVLHCCYGSSTCSATCRGFNIWSRVWEDILVCRFLVMTPTNSFLPRRCGNHTVACECYCPLRQARFNSLLVELVCWAAMKKRVNMNRLGRGFSHRWAMMRYISHTVQTRQ